MKKSALISFLVLGFTGCTYSVNVIHTEGHASEVIDDSDTVTPSATFEVPQITPNLA